MKNKLLGLGLAAAFAAAPASAATLYGGHGIPAEDGLPVDICLAGNPTPLFTGVTFGAFAEVPGDLPAGRYDVEVRLAGTNCDGAVAAAASVFLGLGENATAFAHLTEQGTPTITKCVNLQSTNVSPAIALGRQVVRFDGIKIHSS